VTVLVVSSGFVQELSWNAWNDDWLTGPNHLVGAARRPGIGRVAVLKGAAEFNLRGIDMGDGEPMDATAVARDVDGTPIGYGRHRERRDRLQCLFIIK
jgi:hypothetical protein